jgi:hypothetical protein
MSRQTNDRRGASLSGTFAEGDVLAVQALVVAVAAVEDVVARPPIEVIVAQVAEDGIVALYVLLAIVKAIIRQRGNGDDA